MPAKQPAWKVSTCCARGLRPFCCVNARRPLLRAVHSSSQPTLRCAVLQGMIEAQAQGGAPWAAYAQRLLDPGSRLFRWPRPGGHDDKAHPPIHPLKPYAGGDRDKEQLFEFIVRHFLA